jgi:hypothetical protein
VRGCIIRTHNEPLTITEMRVSNEQLGSLKIRVDSAFRKFSNFVVASRFSSNV